MTVKINIKSFILPKLDFGNIKQSQLHQNTYLNY